MTQSIEIHMCTRGDRNQIFIANIFSFGIQLHASDRKRPRRLQDSSPDTAAVPLTVPGGTEALRVQLEGHRAADDMDVYLYRDGVLTALATGKSSDETLTLVEPPAGDYTAYVVSASAANGTTTTGQLYTWVLPPADAGNLTGPGAVAAAPGQSFGFRLTWTDELSPTSRWFGVVRYGDSDRRTLVSLR